MKKKLRNLIARGAMMREVTEQDVEKAEQSITPESTKKDVEKADSSTKVKVTEPDIDEAENSSKREATKPDIGEADSSTKHEVTKPDIDEAESSRKPEITEQDDVEFTKILEDMKMPKTNSVESPKLPKKGEGSCCIFRIPQSLTKIHQKKGYEPEIVSIGPYHHEKEHLQMMEDHKHRYLQLFLNEVKDGVTMSLLVKKILKIETAIRNSYSDKLVGVDNQPKLLKMMLLDGCFILMLFFFIARIVDASDKSPHDPILTTPWILATIRSDLLLLENQVPFILLKTLLEESKDSSLDSSDVKNLAFKFFNLSMVQKEELGNHEAKHLLDLIRNNFIPVPQNPTKTSSSSQYDSRLILSAKRLRLQGIKFKASHDQSSLKVCCKKMIGCLFNESNAVVPRSSQEKTILEIKLYGNELHIPPIVFDGSISSLLLNCVAFEQLSSKCGNEITSYVVFMGCLMNDEADATYLIEKGIIENYFGNGSEVSQFFKNICKDVAFDMNKSYLKEEFEGINQYTSNRWNVEWARFKHLHFDSPWTVLSSLAVLAAILLSMAQTTFTGLSYFSSS
ncbi:unnamed protein product [Arabis nemorensis]|uniref:Uncharacterized protein n=1 Tax=Arabis nemorensis TaxID=586526 RepID=A0A565BH43_9BRAS|nr:unnamed protein product [Arabis nemorensis]